ncbi:MAG: PAS domain S-box protein [Pseudomonadales bacterium]|nr:PAS domain S-box protein [Pseudomonadales bacterium]
MKFTRIRANTFIASMGVICIILALQVSLALYVNYLQLTEELRNELFRAEIADAMQFQGILQYLLRKQDMEQIQEEISMMSIEPAVSKAVFFDQHMIALASTKRADNGKSFAQLFQGLANTPYKEKLVSATNTLRFQTMLLDEMNCWVLFQPIVFPSPKNSTESTQVGFLVKKIDLTWVEERTQAGLVWRVIPTLLPVVLGAIFFAILANLLHTRRLKVLSQLVKDISLQRNIVRSSASFPSETKKITKLFGILEQRSYKFVEKKQNELTAAVEAIAVREKGLSLMLDSIGDGIIATDTQARVIRMNAVAEDLTACNFSEAEGGLLTDIFSVVDSETREKVVDPVASVLSTGRAANPDNRTLLVSRDGSEYQISDSAAPIKTEDGEILGVILVFRDITEYFKLQQSIFQRNQLLEAVLDNMPQLLAIKNLDGSFINVNRAFDKAFGFENESVIGKATRDVFPATIAEIFEQNDEMVLREEKSLSWENEAETILGTRTYLTTKFPLYDHKEEVYAICGMSLDISEQLSLLNKLQDSNNNLKAIIDHAPAIIYTQDLEGTFLLANQKLSNLFGIPLEQIIGAKIDGLMSAAEAEQHSTYQQLIQQCGETQEFVEQYQIDGEERHFLTVMFPLIDEDKVIYAIGGISTDITARYLLEQAAIESERHLRLYREQNPFAFVEWSPEFKVVDWNPAAEKLFGYSKEEAMGRHANDLIVPEHIQAYVQGISESLGHQTGGQLSANENITKSGKAIFCQWENTPIIDENGYVIGVASSIQDISTQNRVEKELKAQEIERDQILNHIVDGVITVDEGRVILSFNRSAETLFGYKSQEIIGRRIENLIVEEQYSSRAETGSANDPLTLGFNKVLSAQRKNGEPFDVRLSTAELPMSASGEKRYVISCKDVTELQKQELQLQQVRKMQALGKLTGGIAHDYNNMLGVVLGYVDLLQEKEIDEDVARYVDQIKKAGQRGASLTNKLLAFSRQKSTESEAVLINTLIEDEREMLEKTLTPRITLITKMQENLWLTWADQGEFEDALLNLSINAMHAIEGAGELTLMTSNRTVDRSAGDKLNISAGDYVVFCVDDSGIGMNSSVSSRIFDPFFTTKGEAGSGLGLSQVYGFMQRSGGTITVTSTPTIGTRFELFFPRHIVEVVPRVETFEAALNLSAHGKETILIVDDEPAIRELNQELLSNVGYQVISAEDAHEALKILETTAVDLVISDVVMPMMDGYQLARELKLRFPSIKIQLVSGFTGDYQPDALDLGLQHKLLVKPVKSTTLYKRVRELLDAE